MIINEMAGSGGDLMPYMFKRRKIGPLIGSERGVASCTLPTRRHYRWWFE
jgi:C-terminal processing protease CtpA/Prc